jgi:hypothetical protein
VGRAERKRPCDGPGYKWKDNVSYRNTVGMKALKKRDRRVLAYGKRNNNLELMDMSTKKLIIGILAFGSTKSS